MNTQRYELKNDVHTAHVHKTRINTALKVEVDFLYRQKKSGMYYL